MQFGRVDNKKSKNNSTTLVVILLGCLLVIIVGSCLACFIIKYSQKQKYLESNLKNEAIKKEEKRESIDSNKNKFQ